MRYISTRGEAKSKAFLEILLEGLAGDGGLYVPEAYIDISTHLDAMKKMTYPTLAFSLLSKFVDDIPAEDLRKIVEETYTKQVFGSDEVVPITKLEEGLYLAGLSEGPTLAFKDVALQPLGRLFEFALAQKRETLNILGATSGDTGSAAEYAMRGRKGIKVFMLSPLGRMSEFQRRQMYTLQDPAIFNIAIRGTFDDCQDIVKALNEDAEFKKRYKIGSVNSINWARIAAQIVYYFWAYLHIARSNEEEVSFAIPTGNFGNILAGYIAKRMGLPLRRLILATNENNVLEEFVRIGRYRPRKGSEVDATSSPSMDISRASNFERYIFDLVNRDRKRMAALWNDLKGKGEFVLSSEEFSRVAADGFVAGSSTHADRIATIRMVKEKYRVLIDPHTADGMKVGLQNREKDVPLICLETAQPAKFAETIKEAIGKEPPVPEQLKRLADLPERFETFDPDSGLVKKYIAAHVS